MCKKEENFVSLPLYLLSRRRFVNCPISLVMVWKIVLIRLFRAPAECYTAFVEMESSECESADDRGAKQLPTVHCTSEHIV